MNNFMQALNERIEKASSPQSLSAYKIVKNLYEKYHIEPLKKFYEWYAERNAVTRPEVLNELEKQCGMPVGDYPKEPYRYSLEFVMWYSGMNQEQVRAAHKRFSKEKVDKIQDDINQGILELKHKAPKGELDL